MSDSPPFLNDLPVEIRREVYKYLLVNPFLATLHCICGPNYNGEEGVKGHNYSLTPAILRTCRQIYNEALDVLYAQPFIVYCEFNNWSKMAGFPSPLTRYIVGGSRDLYGLGTKDWAPTISAIQKVRHWRVILKEIVAGNEVANIAATRVPSKSFAAFCDTICSSAPRRVEIILLRNVVTRDTMFMEPCDLLRPIFLLRNVGLLTFGTYWPFKPEIQKGWWPVELANMPVAPGRLLKKMLKNIAESSRPRESLRHLSDRLVRFAQAFERYVPFKLEMQYGAGFPQSMLAARLNDLGYMEYSSLYDISGECVRNPSRHYQSFLEYHLCRAVDYAHKLDSRGFKLERKLIVDYLVEHYKRLEAASKKVNSYIQSRPQLGARANLSKDYPHICIEYQLKLQAVHLVSMIEEYAASFERYHGPSARGEFRLQRKRFDSIRQSFPREILLSTFAHMVDDADYVEFDRVVAEVVADMDTQLAEIREAGQHVFDDDVYGERFCDSKINVEDDQE